jgi:hypothetical protein
MRRRVLVAVCFALVSPALRPRARGAPAPWQPEKRWVYVTSNLYVGDNLPKLDALFGRAARCGYNGVLFSDFKTMIWWKLEAAERWRKNAAELRRLTKKHGLELHLCVFPVGYSEALLWHDPNLAAGVPLRDTPLLCKGQHLVPEQTALFRNGSFEEHRGHKALHFAFQDGMGKQSFIDRKTIMHGAVSLRFENPGSISRHGNARICQEFRVQPWQQYRVRAWFKADRLTASMLQLLVMGKKRVLQYQHLAVGGEGKRRYVGSPRDLTTDWVEQSVSFNSLDYDSVKLYAGVWGGRSGTFWWDNIRVEPMPTLNLLRRRSLPLVLRGDDGTPYEEGRDYERIVDPGLGKRPWSGTYDTHHTPPPILLTRDSRIANGERVRMSGYHAALVYDAQVSCSLSEPAVFDLCAAQVRHLRAVVQPDGYLMSHDEIRCAGWEPQHTGHRKSTGALLAANVRKCFSIAGAEDPGKPVCVWSDMFDPHHNAHADYYLANNSFEKSWEGLQRDAIIMKWGGGERARKGLKFFADRGHRQMIAAYYDGNVEQNQRMWTEAAGGIEGVMGVMYTTWRNNYRDLERFAQAWWGDGG